MPWITDAQRIEVDVVPHIEDVQLLQVNIYNDRVTDNQELLVDILPLVTSSQRILATMLNQAYGLAGQERILAPDAAITFE